MFKKYLLPLLLVVVLTLTSFGPAFASQSGPVEPLSPAPSAETGEMVDETPTMWFVELTGAPSIEGLRSAPQTEQANFRAAARAQKIAYKERYSYTSLFNGFSVKASISQIGKLRRLPGVKAIYPVMKVPMPETTSSTIDPDLFSALSMTGADVAQSELGYTGKGIKVAVMDTGIDFDHPDLGGCFGPGCRVYTGWDFVGDAYNADDTAASYNPITTPDPIPDDCAGHGTHVAGIVGANGVVKGVAPNVKFGAYRVFGCEGSTTDDVMLAAMERAYKDGMQVLNMSIGSAFSWPQSPTGAAASRLVKKGMVVVASIGNSGANGLYAAGAPGLGEKVIGVASFDNVMETLNKFTVSPDATAVGFGPAASAPLPPTSGTFPMARTGTTTTANDACAALPAGSLTGQIALIRRGTCSFYIKASNAQNAGAIGVVLYNNTSGRISPTVAGTPAITIPVVAITAADGALIDSRLAAGPVDLTWTADVGSFPSPTGGLISSFSSYGLSPDLALKPDIGAPGGNIYSTYPLELGGYATLSGTSMASPHVAGAAALLLQARNAPGVHWFRHVAADEVMDVLQNSAEPADWWGYPGIGYLDNVHRQGAGMLQIDKAILANTRVQPGKLSLGESEKGPVTRELEIENSGETPVTYDFSFVNALSTSGVITPKFWESNASVAFNVPSITVPRHGEKKIKVTITAPTTDWTPDQGQYGGYIVITPRDGGQVVHVPFAGFVGDYQSIQVLTPTVYGFPFLGDMYGDDTITTYTLASGDMPYVWAHFEHQARQFKLDVYDVNGKFRGNIFTEEYWGRNSTSTSYYAFPWDGTLTKNGKAVVAPDGQYTIKLSILKALGDSKNPAHWETWTSTLFTIDRP